MKKNKKKKKKNIDKAHVLIITGFLMILVLTISVVVISLKNDKKYKKYDDENEIETMSGGIDLDDETIGYDEGDIIVDNLPFIRLNRYNQYTGERYGIMVTNSGLIYKYSFIETQVEYPNSDRFVIKQTLYFDNIKEELGKISEEDLENLKYYSEGLMYDYATNEAVFDTVGESISVTNYITEDNIVLINSEGIKNLNVNTNNMLSILGRYNISL